MIERIGLLTGCGRGIGYSIATKILKSEESTLLVGISRSFNSHMDNLSKLYPNRFKFFEADICDYEKIKSVINRIYDEFGVLDFAICNAGCRSRRSVDDSSLDLYRSILEINTISNINISKIIINKNIKYNAKLNILYLSSIVGSRGFNDLSTYAVSKLALEGFMKSAAVEYAKDKIVINSLSPGFIKSSYAAEFEKSMPELFKWTLEQTPLGRWGNCDEVAELAIFAVSEKNSYMTGTVLYCDGGWTAK